MRRCILIMLRLLMQKVVLLSWRVWPHVVLRRCVFPLRIINVRSVDSFTADCFNSVTLCLIK